MESSENRAKKKKLIHVLWSSAVSIRKFSWTLWIFFEWTSNLIPHKRLMPCSVFWYLFCALRFLFCSFWSSAQHSHYLCPTRWFGIRVFTKVLGLSNPALFSVLLSTETNHWNDESSKLRFERPGQPTHTKCLSTLALILGIMYTDIHWPVQREGQVYIC